MDDPELVAPVAPAPESIDLVPAESAFAAPAAKPKCLRPWGPWATLGWTVLILLATFVVNGLLVIPYLWVLGPERMESVLRNIGSHGAALMAVTLLSAPYPIGFCILIILARQQPVREYLALRWPRRRAVVLSLVGMIALIAAMELLSYVLKREVVPEFLLEAFKTSPVILLVLTVVVAAPVWEEVLMRGFLFEGLASRWGGIAAVVITSLVFASLHLQYDLYGMGQVLAMGLYLGAVRMITGSVYTTILLHFAANAFALIELALWLNWPG